MAKSWKDVNLRDDGPEIHALKVKLDRQMAVLNVVFIVVLLAMLVASVAAGPRP